MKLYLKLIASLGFIGFQSIGAYWKKPEWLETNFKLGFGPVWTSFLGDDRYTIISNDYEGSNQNKIGYNVGPWLDGSIKTALGDYFIVDIYGGGGWITKGYGSVILKTVNVQNGATSNTTYYELDLNVDNNFLITFAGAGPCYNYCDKFSLALTAGYAFSKNKICGVEFIARSTRFVNTKWKAPYIGIGGKYNLSENTYLEIDYKALFGHANSQRDLTVGATITKANRFIPKFFGNMMALHYGYKFENCWETGISFLYNEFQNTSKGCISPSTTATTKNIYLNRLRFDMFALTFFLKYSY